MKVGKTAFAKYVSEVRKSLPARNHDRAVVVLSEYTKAGQDIIERASHWEGNDLRQVYDKWSDAKQQAFDDCWEMYCNSDESSAFGICSHNTFGFTVSWVAKGCVVFVTHTTEYLVLCDE